MTTDHTPWTAQAQGEANHSVILDARKHWVAAIQHNGEFMPARQDEHARLFAAAPELLAVAQLLALATDEGDDAAQGTHYVRDGRIYCKGSFLDTIERARAAIAKATGSAA